MIFNHRLLLAQPLEYAFTRDPSTSTQHGGTFIGFFPVFGRFSCLNLKLESETFSPGNQGFRLRFNRAIWMASPIHWSVELLRDL
jgi:hypothetical protein